MNPAQLVASSRDAVTRATIGSLAWRRRQSLLTMTLLSRLRRLWQRGNRPRQWAKMKGRPGMDAEPATKAGQSTATATPGSSAEVTPTKPEASC